MDIYKQLHQDDDASAPPGSYLFLLYISIIIQSFVFLLNFVVLCTSPHCCPVISGRAAAEERARGGETP